MIQTHPLSLIQTNVLGDSLVYIHDALARVGRKSKHHPIFTRFHPQLVPQGVPQGVPNLPATYPQGVPQEFSGSKKPPAAGPDFIRALPRNQHGFLSRRTSGERDGGLPACGRRAADPGSQQPDSGVHQTLDSQLGTVAGHV